MYGLFVGLLLGLVVGLLAGLSAGLYSGLLAGLLTGLYSGLSRAEIEAKMVPSQGLRQSAKNALIVGLVGGLVGGSGVVLVGELSVGVAYALLLGQGFFLLFGGKAVILHLVLRYFLWRKGYLPWNLARFLDYAAERIFLRKVGGGYIFIHRLLQDYFASLYQDQ